MASIFSQTIRLCFGNGILIAIIKFIRKRNIYNDNFAWDVIVAENNLIEQMYDLHTSSCRKLADYNIPYQERIEEEKIKQKLRENLDKNHWLLIVGREGSGKTREAAELAQDFSKEGWIIFNLKYGKWLEPPSGVAVGLEERKISPNSKLLFIIDDIHRHIKQGNHQQNENIKQNEFIPKNVPFIERLNKTIKRYGTLHGYEYVFVMATISDREVNKELNKELIPKTHEYFWNKFKEPIFLPDPEEKSMIKFLKDNAERALVNIKEEDCQILANQSEATYQNLILNLRSAKDNNKDLNQSNFQQTSTGSWRKRYEKVVEKYSSAKYIYDSVDLLKNLSIKLNSSTVITTTKLIIDQDNINILQKIKYQWKASKDLKSLIKSENILNPRDAQIEAKGYKIEVNKYIDDLFDKIIHLTEMKSSIYPFGMELVKLDKYEKALACFDKIIEFSPETPNIYWWKGITLYFLGKFEDAINFLNQAFESDPQNHDILHILSLSWRELGKPQAAIDCFDSALKTNKDKDNDNSENILHLHNLLNSKACTLMKMGTEETLNEAIKCFNKIIEFDSCQEEVWSNRGVAFKMLGKYDDSIESYESALKVNPEYKQALLNMGLVYWQRKEPGDLNNAIQYLDRALKISHEDSNSDAHAYYLKACCHSLINEAEQALEDLKEAIILNSNFKEEARKDSDFDNICEQNDFQQLTDNQINK